MPLEILLALVIGGIAVIAWLLHMLGLSKSDPLSDDDARAAWLRHYPDDPPREVWLSADGRAALVRTDAGPGLLWRFGADTVARLLVAPQLRPTPEGLALRFADPGAPGVTLTLSPEDRARWADVMEAT